MNMKDKENEPKKVTDLIRFIVNFSRQNHQ